jgi:hypothetical protein
VGFLINYGSFVGGYIYNNGSITTQVYVQASCGQVPGGSSGAYLAGHRLSPAALYEADLKRAASEQ